MAIDTAAKRLSMLDFCGTVMSPGIPIPDGTFDAGDRAHMLLLYAGFAGAAPEERRNQGFNKRRHIRGRRNSRR